MWSPWVYSRTLKAVRTPLAVIRNVQRRSQHTKPFDAAVIGGGITGLTTAFRLSQDDACSQVTLYEKSSRIGGWVQSETIPVDGGHVVFEYGPRTLRIATPTTLPLLDLLLELGLEDQILLTKSKEPAATNRYIYYPDHLVRLPTADPSLSPLASLIQSVKTLIYEPVFETFIWSVITEQFKGGPSDPTVIRRDESVADFVSRRLSPQAADNLVSAVIHGIYAGDIDRLSAQTVMGLVRNLEGHPRGIIRGYFETMKAGDKPVLMDEILALHSTGPDKQGHYWKSLSTLVHGANVLTLKKGVGQLTDALVAALNKSDKVKVITGTEVKAINRSPNTADLTVTLANNKSTVHNRVVATNPAPDLAVKLAQPSHKDHPLPQNTIGCLKEHNYAVSVMVVNLYYPNPNLVPVRGFGYLIPRSTPFDQNPERALGVIFGSETGIGQDTAPGTKLTVMLGGHWWDDWKESDYPDHDTAVSMCRSLLERHLGITEAPTLARSRLKRNSIPQYTVGHLERMQRLSRTVRDEFQHRLTLAGNWYNGIGVTDCIRQAYLTSTFGMGTRKSEFGPGNSQLVAPKNLDWELEGGIVTSPVRFVQSRKHFS